MDYKCKSIPLTSLIASHNGFVKPLCENCKTIDCTNNIEKRKMAEVGIIKERRVLVKHNDIFIVVECVGFSL